MYILGLADIKRNCRKKILLFSLKDYIFNKYICEIYILADIKWIVENQDLYRNKDDFENIFKIKKYYILN